MTRLCKGARVDASVNITCIALHTQQRQCVYGLRRVLLYIATVCLFHTRHDKIIGNTKTQKHTALKLE